MSRSGPHIAVVGAGAFGGWTALSLVSRGARVTLIDAWGPGNPRASSGGETRVIRATYGSHVIYTRMAARALELWREEEAGCKRGLLRDTGALWMFSAATAAPFIRASTDAFTGTGLRLENLTISEAARRYPQIRFEGVDSVLVEPDAGYLLSRRACRHVVERFVAQGGAYRAAAVSSPAALAGSPARAIRLADGTSLQADIFVFACGPWLRTLLPDVIGPLITVTKQDVYYFGVPAADDRFSDARLPVWIDFGERFIYGIPGPGGTFKLADDTPGPEFDPSSGERRPDDDGVARARAFLADRFPALAGTPLVASEVCQYESTPDSNFIIDRHPHLENVWIAGGGSGHGFKMGPAVGEALAGCILDGAATEPTFALQRFAAAPPGGWRAKWA